MYLQKSERRQIMKLNIIIKYIKGFKKKNIALIAIMICVMSFF